MIGIVGTFYFGTGPLVGIVPAIEFWGFPLFENWQPELQLTWSVDYDTTLYCLYIRIGKFTSHPIICNLRRIFVFHTSTIDSEMGGQ